MPQHAGTPLFPSDAELIERLGLAGEDLPQQQDRAGWPVLRARFTEVFQSKTRDEWCQIMEGSDVCFAPVLTMSEAPHHPAAKARNAYVNVGGFDQPAPAPRFSRTPSDKPTPPDADRVVSRNSADGCGRLPA